MGSQVKTKASPRAFDSSGEEARLLLLESLINARD